jgi:hypothetical protein
MIGYYVIFTLCPKNIIHFHFKSKSFRFSLLIQLHNLNITVLPAYTHFHFFLLLYEKKITKYVWIGVPMLLFTRFHTYIFVLLKMANILLSFCHACWLGDFQAIYSITNIVRVHVKLAYQIKRIYLGTCICKVNCIKQNLDGSWSRGFTSDFRAMSTFTIYLIFLQALSYMIFLGGGIP